MGKNRETEFTEEYWGEGEYVIFFKGKAIGPTLSSKREALLVKRYLGASLDAILDLEKAVNNEQN